MRSKKLVSMGPGLTALTRMPLGASSRTAAGAGVAALPIFAGAQHPGLVRISPQIEGPEMGLWILSHPDVRGNARIRAVAAFLAQAVPIELERIAAGDAVRAGRSARVA